MRARDKVKGAYDGQKKRADRKQIGFHFTYEEWCHWWYAQLGIDWFTKRGNKDGQYVMARNGDVGPYHPNNVRCITCNENGREMHVNIRQHGEHHPRARLTEVQALFIKRSTLPVPKLMKKFNIAKTTVIGIRNGHGWKHLRSPEDP